MPQALTLTAAAVFVSWMSVAALVPILKHRGAMDIPNSRSSHEVPIPRGGGIGLLAGFGVGLAVAAAFGLPMPGWPVIVGLALMAGLGAYEDFNGGLPVAGRLVVQVAAAGFVIQSLGPMQRLPLPAPMDLELGPLGWPLSVLWVVGVVNIFNFLDGIDGFAGFQGAVARVSAGGCGLGELAGPRAVLQLPAHVWAFCSTTGTPPECLWVMWGRWLWVFSLL